VRLTALQSEILRFIVENGFQPGDRLPTIQQISKSMDASVAKTRESLEVARALGAVEIRPGRGTRVADFSFAPTAIMSALYSIGQDERNFEHLREARNGLEAYFWDEAVTLLTADDVTLLRAFIQTAREQLARQPIQVPADSHRRFHLTRFARLENPFVQGILEAFWESYEAFGLNLYYDLNYHRSVWNYHERIVDAIEARDFEGSRRLLVEHMNLLEQRPAGEVQRPDARPARFE
jgi:DNA-binding FadR family transcriptional regulator